MSKFNTYEKNINVILKEETDDAFGVAQRALKNITGSELFSGPGIVMQKYDSSKGYYPNIRSKGNLVNIDISKANQIVIDAINDLKQKTKDIEIPSTPIPRGFEDKITYNFSSNFLDEKLELYNKNLQDFEEMMESVQGIKSKKHNDVVKALKIFKQKQGNTEYKNLVNAIQMYKEEINQNRLTAIKTMTYLLKSHIITMLSNIDNFLRSAEQWNVLFKTPQGSPASSVGPAIDDKPMIGDFLSQDIKIYRDKWDDFLDNIANSIVGATQRGWMSAPTAYNIIIGRQQSRYVGRGGLKYKEDVATVKPDVLKQFHERIMKPLFLDNKKLIYATPEQWKSISSGGLINKTITGLGRQFWTGAQNQPKVSL